MAKKEKSQKDKINSVEAAPFGAEQAAKAIDELRVYAQGKLSVDNKATQNQEWWRLRHWGDLQDNVNKGVRVEVGSAWTVNLLLNKHADIMDSFPKPNILPREADDEEEATVLASIIPAILERNDYEAVYRRMGWDIAIDGAAITGVFWDSTKQDGLGDITITNIDVHNLFWQPGVSDIQDGKYCFNVTLQDIDDVKVMYPEVADKIGPHDPGTVVKYIHDDNIDTSKSVEVVDCYYKKINMKPVYMEVPGRDGTVKTEIVHSVPKEVVHLAKIVGGEVVFCSENTKGYENGFYEHGKYPFVIRGLFPIKDSPWSFGYLDIAKNPQRDIDKLDQAIIKNAALSAKPRYWVKANSGVDIEDFKDWSKDIVEVAGGNISEDIKPISVGQMPTTAQNHLIAKIDELKETTGNRDFSQGSVSAGVTAAAAIAALQEAGSKLSRDINKELYRGSREEYYLIIELMRQFYSEQRSFRIDTDDGYSFVPYSNIRLVERDETDRETNTTRHVRPIFDIQTSAEKQSPFSRASQNEMAKELYSLGLFNPARGEQALICLDMMDFEGKDKTKAQIRDNVAMFQQLQAALDIVNQAAQVDPVVAQVAAESGLIAPEEVTQTMQPRKGSFSRETPEERASRTESDTSRTVKERVRAASSSVPDIGGR